MKTDATRTAAAVLLEELSTLATVLAKRVRSEDALPAPAVARLAVAATRVQTRLSRHAASWRLADDTRRAA
jgi:hypothetical protein